jgi:hypothetical protein
MTKSQITDKKMFGAWKIGDWNLSGYCYLVIGYCVYLVIGAWQLVIVIGYEPISHP